MTPIDQILMLDLWVLYPTGLATAFVAFRVFDRLDLGGFRDGRLRDYERSRGLAGLLGGGRELVVSEQGVDVFVSSRPGGLWGRERAVEAPGAAEPLQIGPATAGHHGVRTGDPGFDDAVCVQGDPRRVRALLTSSLRDDLVHLVREGLRLADGRLTMPITRTARWWRVDLRARQVARMHRRIADGWARPARVGLREIAEADPCPDVRRVAIEEMSVAGLGSRDRRALLRGLVADTRGQQRLDLASLIDDRRTWCSVHDDPRETVEVRAEALARLAAVPPGVGADAVARARRALWAPSGALRRAAIAVAARRGGGSLVDDVRQALHGALDTDSIEEAWVRDDAAAQRLAVAALAHHGDADDVAWIARRLHRFEPDAVRAALGAVERRGSLAEVEPLLLFAEGAGRAHAQVVQQVVHQLQASVAHVDAGRLSVVSLEDVGALSVADDHTGRLGVADEVSEAG